MDRDDCQAVPGLGRAVSARAVGRSDRPVGRGKDAIANGVSNQQQVVDSQCVLENEKHVAFCDRTAGRQTDRTLRAGIDGVAHVQDIAQHDLGDRCDRRILEVQGEAPRAVVLRGIRGCSD